MSVHSLSCSLLARLTLLQCQRRAYDAITGVGGYLCHGYFNYQYYAQSVFGVQEDDGDGDAVDNDGSVIPDNANLIVIRNDHIVDDWNTINLMIGGFPEDAIQSEDIPMNNVRRMNRMRVALSFCLLCIDNIPTLLR
jgi:hypothetical protein